MVELVGGAVAAGIGKGSKAGGGESHIIFSGVSSRYAAHRHWILVRGGCDTRVCCQQQI